MRTIRSTRTSLRFSVLLLCVACAADSAKPAGPSTYQNDAGAGNKAGGSGGEPAASTDAARFLADYAKAVCGMYEPCCEAEALGYDADGCSTWFRKVTAAYFKGSFQPEAGAACLSELASARAADTERCKNVLSFDDATLRENCRRAFGGAERDGAALGEKCLLAGDCARVADADVICYGGLCLWERRGSDGDGPCYLSGRPPDGQTPTQIVQCPASDGLYCQREERVCRPLVEAGGYCPTLSACQVGATCSGGTCVALPGPDEPCLNAVRGAGGTCKPGSSCDATTLICGAPIAEGERCREPAQCVSGACMNGVCTKPEFTRALNCTGKS